MDKQTMEEFAIAAAHGINEFLQSIRGARTHADVVVETQPAIRLIIKLPDDTYLEMPINGPHHTL
jgi:hypothetical protein